MCWPYPIQHRFVILAWRNTLVSVKAIAVYPLPVQPSPKGANQAYDEKVGGDREKSPEDQRNNAGQLVPEISLDYQKDRQDYPQECENHGQRAKGAHPEGVYKLNRYKGQGRNNRYENKVQQGRCFKQIKAENNQIPGCRKTGKEVVLCLQSQAPQAAHRLRPQTT